jgi:hypothetical protein
MTLWNILIIFIFLRHRGRVRQQGFERASSHTSLDPIMTARRSDDEGGRSQAWAQKPMNNGQIAQRSVPERSRTLSSSELHRDQNSKSGGLQSAATTPVGSSQTSVSGTSNASTKTYYAMSRSEDGHSMSQRGLGNEAAPPTPSPVSQTFCASCGTLVAGQFVRALGVVFHRACFICSVSQADDLRC